MSEMRRPRYVAIDLGELPVEAINRALGTELEPGRARLSARAHEHIAVDHPADYAVCLDLLPQVITNPSFIGQDPRHTENFELVRRVPLQAGAVLVAVCLEPDGHGAYRVVTAYLITPDKLDRRRRVGTLHSVALVGLLTTNEKGPD